MSGSTPARYYHILYTHKDKHPEAPGLGEQYRIPGFPYDEAEAVMRVWYEIAQDLRLSLEWIRPRCSGSLTHPELQAEIVDGPYAVIGSPKGNIAAHALMKELETLAKAGKVTRTHRYTMKIADDGRCFLKGDGTEEDLYPDPTTPIPITEVVDYAMLMTLPNLLATTDRARRAKVLLLAGCKVAGQFALTEWLFSHKNLAYLEKTYGDNCCYVILKVRYRYVPDGIPNILETKKVFEGPMTFGEPYD